MELETLLEKLATGTIFLVVDETAWQHSGAAELLVPVLRKRNVVRFNGFAMNPKLEDVARGLVAFRRQSPEAVVAFGGGSAIDLGKLIGICGAQDGPPEDYILGRKPLQASGPPLIAIPTTAGTGSEATHFAVAYVDGQKYSLAHERLLPDFAILDPRLTASLPAAVTASSGLDALCQAIESIWSVGATEESIDYASQAITLAMQHLETAVLKPTAAARRAMLAAAHLSGKAINISKTTAPHAFSYAVTTGYHVPHGAAVALTLGAFLGYNSQVDDATCSDPRGAAHVQQRIACITELLGETDVQGAQQRLTRLIDAIGCPTRLSQVDIRSDHLPHLVDQVNAERLANNPRTMNAAALVTLLSSIA